jgi:acetylornithine/N-succinyldiaminopimelate aminotransferase
MLKRLNAVMPITPRPSLIFEKGEGAWLINNDGSRYLDFIQGWAVNTLGHCNNVIVNAIQQQAAQLINASPAYYTTPMVELANFLNTESHLDHVFFTNSGAEANEGAIKLARKWGKQYKHGAYKIITFDNSFHGRTMATMSASGKKGWDTLFEPKVEGFTKVPYNDLVAVERAIDEKTVAVMLEPIQGEAGVISARTTFMQELRQLTLDSNLLLIVDEVQTGIGRTGTLFNHTQSNIKPDIMTLGKGIGGGVPLGAMLASHKASCFEYGDQGGTFNGNALCCAAGLAVLKTVNNTHFLNKVKASGDHLRQGLLTLSQKYQLGEVRGCGLLMAIDTRHIQANVIAEMAFRKGLIINAPQVFTLRFMPALNVSIEEINTMLNILNDVLRNQ